MLARLRELKSDDTGATVVELLMVIMMMTTIGGILMTSLVTGMRTTSSTQQRYDALADLQIGVDRLARELRAADPVTFPAVSTNTVVVQVFRDFPDFSDHERFTYTFCAAARALYVRREFMPTTAAGAITCPTASAGGSFTTPVGTATLLSDVDSVQFEYLEQDGDPAATQNNVFQVGVVATRGIDGQTPITVRTSVRVRNAR